MRKRMHAYMYTRMRVHARVRVYFVMVVELAKTTSIASPRARRDACDCVTILADSMRLSYNSGRQDASETHGNDP